MRLYRKRATNSACLLLTSFRSENSRKLFGKDKRMTAKDLKNALLQEAVQGKLVPQIKSEGNAKDLLEEIRKEKTKFVKEGKLKKEKPLPEITEEDIPFDIPENWCWCRFGDVFQHNTGKTQNSSVETKNGTLRKFITTSNLYWNEFDFTKVKEMLFSENELQRCTVTKGDLLICEGGEYGRAAIWKYDYDVCFQNHVHRARAIKQNTLYVEFYYYLIFLYKNIGFIEGRGVGIKSLSTENLHQVVIPLPPLAEQKRIVAAIEKFMPLIEEYGKKETELKAFNEQIGSLTKKAILQEAVQGKLVPQIATEGNAKDLLEEIKKEKAKVAGKASSTSFASKTRAKEFPPITDDEIPFDIPENWCWCRLGDIISILGDGIHGTPNYDISGNYYFVNGNNLNNGKIEIKPDTKKVNQSEYEKYKKELNNNTVFVSINGTLGNVAFYENEKIILGKSACYFNLIKNEMKSFIYWLIKTKYFLDYANEEATGTTIKNVSLATMRSFPIPLPPLAEQKRIVAAIEKLLPLCEKLGE